MGMHSQRQKKSKAFQMANLPIPYRLHIIMVNSSQLFSLGTFVAKGKFKRSDCVNVLLNALWRVSGRWVMVTSASDTCVSEY